ncbi:MAG: hypothetical protein ABEJ68_07690 [Halobacteriaceae archaeon]
MHREGSIDVTDFVLGWAYPIAVVVLVGIGQFSLFGYSMSDVLWSATGAEVTIAWVVALVCLVGAWATNRANQSLDDMDEIEQAAAGGAALLMIGIPFVPALNNLVMSSQTVGAVAGMILTGAYALLAYY